MVLPSLMISAFLVLGFQREYMASQDMSLIAQVTGMNETNANQMDQNQIDGAITTIS